MCRRRLTRRADAAVPSALRALLLARVIRTKQTVHVADMAATQDYAERHPAMVALSNSAAFGP